jgi:hypothetical protein
LPPPITRKWGETRPETYGDSQGENLAENYLNFDSQPSGDGSQMNETSTYGQTSVVMSPIHSSLALASPVRASSGSEPWMMTPDKSRGEPVGDYEETGLDEVITDDRFKDNPDEPQCGDVEECPLNCNDDRVVGTKVNREGEATSEPKISIVEIIVDNVINEEKLSDDYSNEDGFWDDGVKNCIQLMTDAVTRRLGEGFKESISEKEQQQILTDVAKSEFQKCRHAYGKYGGRTTRKRKPSKIPRRTIRRRAQRRAQKRTLRRRQRRNKKGTQKRRK